MINILLTSTAKHLEDKLRKKVELNVVLPKKNKEGKDFFPDGEKYIRINSKDFKQGKVVIVHSGYPNPDSGLMELEMILSIISRDLKKKTIEVFFTYFPYSQQDKKFLSGELNVARWIIDKLINNYGVSKIFAIDAHFFGRKWIKNYPFTNLSSLEFFKKEISNKFPKITYLTPDKGSKRRTKIRGFNKKRLSSYEVTLEGFADLNKNIRNKKILIIDDIIETGGTLVKTSQALKSMGAQEVVIAVTHGVLPEGIRRVKKVCSRLYLTNSIKTEFESLDITEILFDSINNREIKT